MDIDVKFLTARLNAVCGSAIPEAIAACAAAGHSSVLVSHVLHALLAEEHTDIHAILAAYRINAGHWRHALEQANARLTTSGDGKPGLSRPLLQWLQDGWTDGALRLEHTRIRSGVLLLSLTKSPARYKVPALPGIADLQHRELLAHFAELTANSCENEPPDAVSTLTPTVPNATTLAATSPTVRQSDLLASGRTQVYQPPAFAAGGETSRSGADESPDKLGKYDIKARIASGSMGVVYLAHDAFINREVAIKLARPDTTQDQRSAERYRRLFFNELHTAGMLNHPNILAVYDAGTEGEQYFIVMEYVQGGRTLADHTDAVTRLPIETVVELIGKCARALHYAHEKGVIHRDIKPSNILLTDDMEVKIADFSVAVIQHPDQTLAQGRGLIGSPRYMSPEQARQERLSNQTDLYSLGVVMYELLAGRPPFQTRNLKELIQAIAKDEPDTIAALRPDLPLPLVEVLETAMNRDTDDRYLTGLAFANALFTALDGTQRDEGVLDRKQLLAAHPFCTSFGAGELDELLNAGNWRTFYAGDQVAAAGTSNDALWLLLDGEMQLMEQTRRLVAGDSFGEAGFVNDASIPHEIVASSEAHVFCLTPAQVDSTSTQCQLRFHKSLQSRLARQFS